MALGNLLKIYSFSKCVFLGKDPRLTVLSDAVTIHVNPST